jgi:DNA-binding response OmpR family regulator
VARIIIIDDDEIVAAIAESELTRGGPSVSSVHHGDDALDAIMRSEPDLVIIDYALPGKTGMQVLREIRALPFGGNMPVMMLTSRSRRIHIIQAVNEGADDYLTKPFDVAELLPRAEALLVGGQIARFVMDATAVDAATASRLHQPFPAERED